MKTLPRKEFRALIERFFEIQIVLNLKKCHHMRTGRNTKNGKLEFENLCLENNKEVV